MPEGIAVLLGKKSPESESKDKGDDDGYKALASGLMKAFKKGDEDALEEILRGCDFLDSGVDYE